MAHALNLHDFSIANLTVGGGDPVALIEAAGESGFGAAGLVLRTAMNKPLSHEIIQRPETIRAVKAASKATGVKVFDVEAFVLRPGVNAASFIPALETGAELGATHISSIGTEVVGNDTFLSEAERIDLFSQLCEQAKRFGLHVGVEFMRYRDIPDLGAALALIDAAGVGNAGIIFDVLHFHRTGGTPEQIAAVPASRIAYIQLCDAGPQVPRLEDLPTEARGGRLHLGDGVIPLNALLDVLPNGPQMAIETPVASEAALTLKEKVASAAEHIVRFAARRAAGNAAAG
ncbi:sugar phosphate isomerase/epimerase family protein [Bosea robiniae]|uniref:Sugar phosphate isomerase/epimerase n=1 Tax=Bosea robiniae TaxID=1036780 RepID=A0ABY0NTX2_9HYPH|nr:TIM barrel protein [Bosea robiniae]SDG13360.1 Sugar phosphate isomerase/epimerase [Bosea robiniae]